MKKQRSHVTLHAAEYIGDACIIRTADIVKALPRTEPDYPRFTGTPPEYVTLVELSEKCSPSILLVTETVAEVQAALDADPVADQLKTIERVLVELLGQMKRS